MAKDVAEKASAAELGRAESLVRQAEKFAAGIIVVMGFQLCVVKTLAESPSPWVKSLCGLSLAVLSVALFLAFYGLQTKGYAHCPRGCKLWENLKPETVSLEAAEEALVQMLLQIREQNARLNDAKNRLLGRCGWLLFAGALLVAGCQFLDAVQDWT
jgi:hypothetical protein